MTTSDGELDHDPEETVRQQLSLWRVFVLLVVLVALAGTGYIGAGRVLASSGPKAKTWFAPYVDATLTPSYEFQDASYNSSPTVVLGFISAASVTSCTPSWGGVYTLSKAAIALNMDRRIVQFEETGGRVIVSFGGKKHTDLASSCRSVSALESAYLAVIQRYGLRAIDLDVEGPSLTTSASLRRAEAVAGVERLMARHGEHLQVWLTLAAGPTGLGTAERGEVADFLDHGVDLAGVNSLDMDFGDDRYPVTDMLTGVETALDDAHSQLATLYARYGDPLSSSQLWAHMGSTVLIGQSDVQRESFGLYDAQLLVKFSERVGLGRVSMWSLNRDSQCGTDFPVIGEISNTCSGVAEGDLQFESIFDTLPGHVALAAGGGARPTTLASHDPYPVWSPDEAYDSGYLVVLRGEVYEAKYYNQGESPDTPVQLAYESPWELLGPVLTSDHAPTATTLPSGTYPVWSPHTAYQQGQRVLYEGLPFIAKYYTIGSSPGAVDVDPQYSPWQPLYSVPNEP